MDMVRVIIVAFTLSLASSVQAMPVSPLQATDSMVVTVRGGCGVGYERVAGRCVRNTDVRHFRRAVRRCARGLRYVDGQCIH
jgi:hypothetical protein